MWRNEGASNVLQVSLGRTIGTDINGDSTHGFESWPMGLRTLSRCINHGTTPTTMSVRRACELYMVQLEFTPDVNAVRDDIAGYELSDVTTLQHTMFELPTRLIVETRDVLALRSGETRSLPIVHVAVHGLDAVRAVEFQSPVYYRPPGGGTLTLVNDGKDSVQIAYSINDVTAIVSYPDLRAAFEEFAVRVRRFLSIHIPTIKQSRVWRGWIESGAAPDWHATTTE